MSHNSSDDIFAKRTEEFCKKIEISPVWNDKKIYSDKAVFHTVTTIRKAVCDVLWIEKVWITWNMLLINLRHGVDVLEQSKWSSDDSSVFAITERWVREVFELIERRKTKARFPREKDINLPARTYWDGSSRSRSKLVWWSSTYS